MARRGLDLATGRRVTLDPADAILVEQRTSPLVLSVPHSGTWLPPESLAFINAAPELLVDTDVASERLYRTALPQASYVGTRVSPYVVNLNRSPRKPSKPVLPPRHLYGWPTHTRVPTRAEARYLRAQYCAPYYRALAKLITAARLRFGFALVVDGHSLNSIGGPTTVDPGEIRATFVVGNRRGASASAAVTNAFMQGLQRRKLADQSVALNRPYKGGWIVTTSGQPQRRIHALQLETRKDAYLRAETYDGHNGGTARLRPDPDRLKAVAAVIRAAAAAASLVASRTAAAKGPKAPRPPRGSTLR